MPFFTSQEELKDFNESLVKLVGNSAVALDERFKKDMSYYMIVDVHGFKIIEQQGLENFFTWDADPSVYKVTYANLHRTSLFFYLQSVVAMYTILYEDKMYLSEAQKGIYSTEYLIKNKYNKIMLVHQSSIALVVDENGLVRSNLNKCLVIDPDYEGTILRDFTPQITINFERFFVLELEIKQKIGTAFYTKMKKINDEVKRGMREKKDKQDFVFTEKELLLLDLAARKFSGEELRQKMAVSEVRLKQIKKQICIKMCNIFEWKKNTIKKFENLLEFMEKNGLFDVDPKKILYP